MYCSYCGNEVKDNSKFCSKCGKEIRNSYENNTNSKNPEADSSYESDIDNDLTKASTKEFIFEASRGGAIFIRGLRKVYRSQVECTPSSLKITSYHGKYKINERTKKELIVNRSHIVSAKTINKIELIPAFATAVFITATFILSWWFIFLTILGFLAVFSKLIQITLSNGEKIKIRYSKTDPYIQFIECINKFN